MLDEADLYLSGFYILFHSLYKDNNVWKDKGFGKQKLTGSMQKK